MEPSTEGEAMRRVTRDDVIKAVGRADDATIAGIIGTGATGDELAEAQAWIANDEPLINAGKPPPSGRVGELIEILAEIETEEDEETGPVVSQERLKPTVTGRGCTLPGHPHRT